MQKKWAGWGSALTSAMFLWAMFRQYFSGILGDHLGVHAMKLVSLFYPYIEITFFEYTGERLRRSEAYAAVESYLSASSCSKHARRLKADYDRSGSGSTLILAMDDHEEVIDSFSGAKLYWSSQIAPSVSHAISFYPSPPDRRFYRLSFHRRHRDLVAKSYLRHVLDEGKAIGLKNRVRRLYTNNTSYDSYDFRKLWSHVNFEHPATFETIAMDPEKKRDIVDDLIAFSRGKEFYSRVGKPWKRGYLLYGPPGTGKSTMIAAMANLLD
ncbi:hypothetical protein MA16_Dca020910 [Dendrobium catenatum]|uniref:AAA-type ATPase N-terminal domain-containing protein n=2 Tax=Dendrobium catenatum TaxID=906689 RepID=A0A2I0VN49_9ASPA|nr:hypothetical protein MA16_Dca020910 [Dendrobium catenatum]